MSLKDERPALLGLQLEQEPRGARDPLPALQQLVRVRPVAGDPLERVAGVVGARPQQALARTPHRQRLPPSHHLHPGGQVSGIGRW